MLLLALLIAAAPADDPRTPAVLAAIGKSIDGFADDATFSIAYSNLGGDRREEAIVFLIDRGWCGSSGCAVFVMTPSGKGWRKIAQTSVSRMPVHRLPTRHNGWNDLAITISGGGIEESGLAAIRFAGGRYAKNPTVAPLVRSLPRGSILLLADRDGDQVPVKR